VMYGAQARAVYLRLGGTARVCRAITLAVLAAGVWSVTASRAEAGKTLIVRQFMCQLPIIGTQPVTVSVARPALDTAVVGVPTPRLRITATGTVTAAARLVVSFLGAEWAEGTGVMDGEVDAPQGMIKESVPFTVPRTNVATGSGPLSASGFGTLPSVAFSRPGEGEVLVSGLTLHLSLLTSGGGQALMSPFNTTCTLASGQSGAVASFRILPAASTPSRSPTRSTATSAPAPTPRPTRTPTPSPVASSRSPLPSSAPARSSVIGSHAPLPSPTPTPPPKPPSRAAYLLWPVGIAVAGSLGGAAWWLLRRRSA
jgi:hypothetical protein